MRILVLTSVFTGCLALPIMGAPAQTDPFVEQMVQAVSKGRVTSDVQTLQDFGTRFTYTDNNRQAQRWLYRYFRDDLKMEVEYLEFYVGGVRRKNVIARIPGLRRPDEIVAISGHFDSTSEDPYNNAPGADDDASAIAGVLEAARILRHYQFDRTIEFMAFNGEEQGRKGSIAIASAYQTAGKNLVAVINSDMIGYWPTDWQRDLDIAYDPISEWLADHLVSAGTRYVGIPITKKRSGNCRDDHVSFSDRGFSATTSMDCWEAHNGGNEKTPHYHRSSDTIDTLNLDCMTQVVQVNLAALAELAGPLALFADLDSLSAAAGGAVHFSIAAGPVRAARGYLLLGSVSGTDPGIPLFGGAVLPLNWDVFTTVVVSQLNTWTFDDFWSALDADGRAAATFNVPSGALVGYEDQLTFYFAYALLQPMDFASNATSINVID